MKAAKSGTKNGFEKTKLAMMSKVPFLLKKGSTVDESEEEPCYIDVSVCELKHPPPYLGPMPEGLSTQQVIRRLILSSIVHSENSYVDSLKRILQEYQKPLLESPHLLSPKKVHQIFYRVKEIHQCHSMFQMAVASRTAEWDHTEKIGDLFVASFSKSMVLNVYSEYINNFTHAMALIKKACTSKPMFLDFLKKKQVSSPDRITLYGLMVKPIQRFPQFILLLQDMLKNTPKAHSDRLALQLALTELETLAESLNEQRRVAEHEAEIQELIHSVSPRTLTKFLKSEHRQLIQCEPLTEIVFGEKGQVLHSKQRKVFLLNDTLICTNLNTKGPPDFNSLLSAGPKYTVKWCAPLLHTEVLEVGQDSDQTSTNRRHSATYSNSGKVVLGPPRLSQELEDLQHDLSVVEEVSQLVCTLTGTYQNLNRTLSEDWCLALQRLIRLKEEEIQNANKCHLRLAVPGKPDRCGRPVCVMVVFSTPSPLSKISWVNRLHLAKMAQRSENCPGWDCPEDGDRSRAPLGRPLLSSKLPVFSSSSHHLKLHTALHCPSQSSLLGFCSISASLPQGYLWVAGGGDGLGQLEVFSLNRSSPRLVKTVPQRAPVLCLDHVRDQCPITEEGGGAQPVVSPQSLMCVGLQDGSVLVYSCVDTALHCLLTLHNPDSAPVLCLTHTHHCLFAGLDNGKVMMYRKKTGDLLWDSECSLLSVGSEPVCTLLTVDNTVWASTGNHVSVIQQDDLSIQRFEAHPQALCCVTHMLWSGAGVWMAFTHSCSLHLFHTETLEHLQEVNISSCTARMETGQGCVSSLLLCQGLLWVGTTLGTILAFPVPTLEGIPKITGKGQLSLNAHCGPVDFLVSSSTSLSSEVLKSEPSESSGDGDGQKSEHGPSSVDPDSLILSEDKPKGVMLRYHLSSTLQLPGKILSARSDQELQASADPLVHSPEDRTIYELSEDPDVWVRARPVEGERRAGAGGGVTSTAVFSGGRGLRRCGKTWTQGQSDMLHCADNSMMVWQLPLTLNQ